MSEMAVSLETYVLSVDETVYGCDGTVTVSLPEVFPSAGVPDPVVSSLLGEHVGGASLWDGCPYRTNNSEGTDWPPLMCTPATLPDTSEGVDRSVFMSYCPQHY